MDAKQFWEKVELLVSTYRDKSDSPHANSGVAFFLDEIEELESEWESEDHKYSL